MQIRTKAIKIPNHRQYDFISSTTNIYQKLLPNPCDVDIDFVPNFLRLENSRKPSIRKNVGRIITDIQKHGNHSFFTGLKPVGNSTVQFIGDHLRISDGSRIISLLYFVFNSDFSGFKLFYFTGHNEPLKLRVPFCRNFKKHLLEIELKTNGQKKRG